MSRPILKWARFLVHFGIAAKDLERELIVAPRIVISTEHGWDRALHARNDL
jgi:hypothetical protein